MRDYSQISLLSLLLLSILFIISDVSSIPAPPASTTSCYDRKNPLDDEITLTGCMLVTESNTLPSKNQVGNQDNMFKIVMECNSTKANFCDKVAKSLEKTGQTISKLVKFKEQVVVHISFQPLGDRILGNDNNNH